MIHAPIAPELEAFPNRYRLTVEACYRLMDLGYLEGQFEVLDGEVVHKVSQNPPHRIAILLVTKWLLQLFDILNIQSEAPIALPVPDGIYSEPEPDVAVTREATTVYADRHPGPGDLLVVVEVADSTLRTDLILKARLYARAGIPEYWVMDLNSRTLHVHREPANGEYSSIRVHTESDVVTLVSRPDAPVAVASLLPPLAGE
jgi:Uma2 family endonuclease